MTARLLLTIALALASACRHTPPQVLDTEDGGPALSLADVAFEYRVGPGDVLRVNVFDHPELSSQPMEGGPGSPVDGTGAVMLPLIGNVEVAGSTVQQIAARVEAELARYLRRPRVDVAVVKFGAQRVFVLGDVTEPGPVVLERPMTALEAVWEAGGFGVYANRKQIAWVRGPLVEENLRLFDATQIDPLAAERVQPGDLLFVGRRSWSDVSVAAQELLPIFAVAAQPLSLAIQALTLERIQ